MRQQALYKIQGMNKDLADSAMDHSHAFDLRNMKLRHDDRNSFTALVNEPGTLKARDHDGNIVGIKGTVVGFTTLNDTGILFTHEEPGVNYASFVTGDEQRAGNTIRGQGLNAPAIDPSKLLDAICEFTIDGTRHAQSTDIGKTTDERSLDIAVSIIRFYNTELYPAVDDITDELLSVAVEQGPFTLWRNGKDCGGYLKISQADVTGVNQNGERFDFIIRYTMPDDLDHSVETQLNGVVSIIATNAIGIGEETIFLSPVEIRIGITVPAADDGSGSGDSGGSGGGEDGGSGGGDSEGSSTVEADPYAEELATACDHIYLITAKRRENPVGCEDTEVTVDEYFHGNLGFDTKHFIESTVYFENDEVQKVYWVDGVHQMRYANIAKRNKDSRGNVIPWDNNLMFDTVPKLHLQESVTVTRNSTGGVFPSGTVQWAFTYLSRYGAESNIVWVSPLHYSSPDDRGGAPDEVCANSFTIEVSGYETDGRFDYIRLYHILRTTLDGEAEVRRVADISIPTDGSALRFTDSNTTGEAVDPMELRYLGGVSVIPQTLEQKSNTLFLGNLTDSYRRLRKVIGSALKWGEEGNITYGLVSTGVPEDPFTGYYSHTNQLCYNSHQITGFRRGEQYRLGFQVQDSTGRWSDVWWLYDHTHNSSATPKFTNGYLNLTHARYRLKKEVVNLLRQNGYRRVRPVAVYPQPWERNIYTEGLLNPTVYNVKDRSMNAPFAQSSWFLRPFPPINLASFTDSKGELTVVDHWGNVDGVPFPVSDPFLNRVINNKWDLMADIAIDSVLGSATAENGEKTPYAQAFDYSAHGSWAEYRHNHPLGDSQQRNGEVQSMYNPRSGYDKNNDWEDNSLLKYTLTFPFTEAKDEARRQFINSYGDFFYVDQSILTLNSADVEFDSFTQSAKLDGYKLRITGLIPMSAFISSYDIQTNTPPNKFYNKDNDSMLIPAGFYGSEVVGAKMGLEGLGWKSFISGALWHDELTYESVKDSKYANDEHTPVGFAVYPWQGTGSLNNDGVGTKKTYDSSDKDDAKNRTGENYISAELKCKTIANLHYSHNTHHINAPGNAESLSVKAAVVLDTQNVALTKIDEPAGSGLGTLHYFGNADKLITPVSEGFIVTTSGKSSAIEDLPFSRKGGYPRMASLLPLYMHNFEQDAMGHLAFYTPYTPLAAPNTLTVDTNKYLNPFSLKTGSERSMSSIPIRYNSCNHIVVAFDYTLDSYQPHLDWVRDLNTDHSWGGLKPYWGLDKLVGSKGLRYNTGGFDGVAVKSLNTTAKNDSFDFITFKHDEADGGLRQGFLCMGQLCRSDEVENRFGGRSNSALEQSQWLPAGESVYLKADTAATLEWSAGDTYYQRYDALRTYPATEEQVNKVIDIVSFMTETHTNIDGRYDKNRGLQNNLHVRPKNFNKLNPVYSQQDNFFTYHCIDIDKVNLDVFRYSFTWSIPKLAGSLRDEWTRVTLASKWDCDGNLGELTRLCRLDSLLVAFQSGGVSQILYDETSQVAATDGLPFELANSGKMQGLRYFSTEIGCQNKWSVAVSPSGVYFIDGRSRDCYSLGTAGLKNVSLAAGMSSWFKSRKDLLDVWNPSEWAGFHSHFDPTTGEVLFTGKDTCLCFDTGLDLFSGFFDYQQTVALFTLGDCVLTVAPDFSPTLASMQDKLADAGLLDVHHLWLHRKSKANHCLIYNKQRESSVEIVCNSNGEGSDYGMTKLFDNMTWRADAWKYSCGDGTWEYQPFITFTELSGFDDYQRFGMRLNAVDGGNGTHQLDQPPRPVNLRKKFKQWHTTMPRALGEDGKEGRDRISDTWCHVKLTLGTAASKYRHVLHDLVISYFIS